MAKKSAFDSGRIFFAWRVERYSLSTYTVLTFCLGAPVLGLMPSFSYLWIFIMLIELRLMDDIVSWTNDRRAHPERVLSRLASRKPLIPIIGTLVVFTAVPLFTSNVSVKLAYLAFLLMQMKIWPSSFKYMALVVLISFDSNIYGKTVLLHMALVFLAANAYELGHDVFPGRKQAIIYGVVVMSSLFFVQGHGHKVLIGGALVFTLLALMRLKNSMQENSRLRKLTSGSSFIATAFLARIIFLNQN